jgi:uncharacterized protein YkwD
MSFKIPTGVIMLVVCYNAVAGDLYADINRLRAADGACAGKHILQPLTAQPALERIAAALARGDTLEQSFQTSGYRATRSRAFNIRGEAISARAAELLAKPENCRQLQDVALSEIGVYVDAQQLWLVMAAPFTPAVAQSADVAGRRVLQLVNEARAQPRNCGSQAYRAARPLSWNTALAAASQLHADDMARNNYFSHSGRDGSNPAQRVVRAGYNYRATGENIAAGQMKPEDTVAGWIKSPPHCANMMNPGFTEMGVAFAVETNSELGVYWAQEFGSPR